jgi:UDP-N-acetylmuramoyl-tripeptide--D-alanyl-D-alanine ligase
MSSLWTSEDLARATRGRALAGFAASGVAIDTRRLTPGDLFVALHGTRDGHDYVAAALAAGAAGALVDHVPETLPESAPLLLVGDTTEALSTIGAAGRARYAGPVVAVTGSVGKTTTKDMLRLCLSAGGPAHAAEASHNNHWGVPLTLARLPPEAPGCAVEIGMNHPGEIAPLARLASPTVAVITAIGSAHIGPMGSLEAIAAEKSTITTGLRPGGTLVVPADTPFLPLLRDAAGGARLVTFGQGEASCRLISIDPDADGSIIAGSVNGHAFRLRLAAPGLHSALDALAALAATEATGLDVEQAASRLEAFSPGGGRGLRARIAVGGGTAVLLDESYNASAVSMRAALAVLALQPARRRIAVLGDMRELGSHSEREHRALAGPVADTADLVFACGPEMRVLFDTLPRHRRGAHTQTAGALIPLVAAELRQGDAILVKGSNGVGLGALVQFLQNQQEQGHAA